MQKAGLGSGLLCRLYLRKEHSSISDWSIKGFSFVGETLGGDLVGLGYGEGRDAEEGWGAAVAVGVGNRDKTRVDAMIGAMSGVVNGLGLLLEERSGYGLVTTGSGLESGSG